MVATSATLPSAQTDLRDNDKVLWIASNYLTTATVTLRTSSESFTAADESAAANPTRRMHDGTRVTKTVAVSTSTDCWILVDAGSGSQITADCLVFENHREDENNSDITVRVSDTVDGGGVLNGTILTPQATLTVATYRNTLLWDSSYTARYWEINFNGAGSFKSEFGQFWLGTQLQMRYQANRPFDPDARFGAYSETVSRTGVRQRVSHASNLRTRGGQMWLNQAAEKTFVENLWENTNSYANAAWFVRQPFTAPENAVYGHLSGNALSRPVTEESTIAEQLWSFEIMELGPRMEP
jgi:hypothetical protein